MQMRSAETNKQFSRVSFSFFSSIVSTKQFFLPFLYWIYRILFLVIQMSNVFCLSEMAEGSERPLIYKDFYWDLLPKLPKELIINSLFAKHRAAVLMTSKSNKELVEKAQNTADELSFAMKTTPDFMVSLLFAITD